MRVRWLAFCWVVAMLVTVGALPWEALMIVFAASFVVGPS